MTVIAWSPRFATGIASIDEQHRQLFDAVNRLQASFLRGKARDETRNALAFLLNYTVEHFRTEEDHMQRLGYPGFAAHAAGHARLVEQVASQKARLDGGFPMTEEVAAFLADWLRHHIHQVDLAYVGYLRARGVE